MSEEKELLILITNKLDIMSCDLKILNQRMDNLEGKTNDIHHYIPFVSWLEEVGHSVSKQFKWIHGYSAQPVLLTQPVLITHDELE
jgi:hypothetical protein